MNFQILRSTPRTLQLTVYSAGTPTDLDANPTLVVTNGAGTVVASGAVIKPGATTGVYESVLPAQANLNVLTAVWTGLLATQAVSFTQSYEIVGNLLFTEADARSEPIVGQQLALADDTKYSDALIAHWRSVIGDIFETRLRRGVVRRYCRLEIAGPGGTSLDLSYGHPGLASGTTLNRPGRTWDITRIISASVGGVAQTVGDLQIVGYKLHHTTGTWTAGSTTDPLNITVEYEYGPDPVDSEVHQRALDLLVANAAPSGFPSTATSISNDDGTFSITTFPAAVEDMFKTRKARAGFGFA
jgi:hypothetical protein